MQLFDCPCKVSLVISFPITWNPWPYLLDSYQVVVMIHLIFWTPIILYILLTRK